MPMTFGSWKLLTEGLASHFASELVLQSGWLLGSLGILGSPIAIARNVVADIHSSFQTQQSATGNATAQVTSLPRGGVGLLTSITTGFVASARSLTRELGRNVDLVSFDQQHVDMRFKRSKKSFFLRSQSYFYQASQPTKSSSSCC